MEKLTKKAVLVNYGCAIINGTVRQSQSKIWHVAVSTKEPAETCNSHAAWMLEMQFLHADTVLNIADLEHKEIMKDIKPYMHGVSNFRPRTLVNS